MVSIIIPIYNTSKFLSQCIESILTQSYKNIQLILVNDASTDESLKVCHKYKKIDDRIVIIDKANNEGVDKARFSGLEVAKGKYVLFVDSDDWLESTEILSTMYGKAEETNADYVEMGMQRVMDRHSWIKKANESSIKGYIQNPELFNKYYKTFFGYNILPINIWGKLYRKETLDKANLQPSNLCMGEDLFFNLMLFPHLKSIYMLDKVGYNYRFGGMTSKYNKHLYPDLKFLFKLKEELIIKYNYFEAREWARIEMKNILFSDICQKIVFKVGSERDIVSSINDELQDQIWDTVLQVEGHPQFHAEPFVKAIAQKDAQMLYNICLTDVKQKKWQRVFKKVISFILTHI